MLTLKVHGGTLPDERLCDRCSHSTIMVDSTGREHVMCQQVWHLVGHSGGDSYRWTTRTMPGEVHCKIVQCSQFQDRMAMTRWEADKIGWVLELDEHKKPVGFRPPGEETKATYRRPGY